MDCHTACMQQHSKNTWGKVSKIHLSSPSLNILVTPRQPSESAVGLFQPTVEWNYILFCFSFRLFFDLDGKCHEVKERCEGECIGAWAANGGKYIRCNYSLLSAHAKILCILCVASCRLYNPEKKYNFITKDLK